MRIYNTMSRSVEEFRPRKRGEVKIFTCGPSIYRRPHIGNYRTFLYEDLLVRYLEYRGYRVERAMPLTDIEDKTILEAIRNNRTIMDLTGDIEKIFIAEARQLKIRLPRQVQRVSACAECAATIIARLVKTGHAYRNGGDIFFDPAKVGDFGKLFRLDMRRWPSKRVRFRRDTYNGNRWNLGDFILWHGYREGDISWWDTAIGKGRPSWNIQDPSVIIRHLGPQVDINCGGIDNIYRHHDYNIAIMESYTGREYARYYMHGAHLIVEGKPMSKSRGNILYPEDIYRKGCAAMDLRFFLLYTHYRKKLNFTRDSFANECRRAGEFRALARRLMRSGRRGDNADPRIGAIIRDMKDGFEAAMDDDLAVGRAFDHAFAGLKAIDAAIGSMTIKDARDLGVLLRKIDTVLGIIF